jgi:hypothetical protein
VWSMSPLPRPMVPFLAAVLLATGAPALEAFDEANPQQRLSCVHEMAYESFAGLILVRVTVGESQPLSFVLDSGATQSSINDPFLASALGVELKEAGLARGVGSGAARVLVAEDIRVRSDGVELLLAPLVVHDIGTQLVAMSGREIDGFLGADLFERFVVEIDPLGRRILLHDPETYDFRGDGYILPLEVVDRRPIVPGTVVVEEGGKDVPVRLLADTGSSRFLSLITKSRRHLKPPEEQAVGVSIGVAGGTVVAIASTRRLRLGSIVAENVETAWMEAFRIPAVRNIDDLNGILGNQLLGRFRAIFDYRGGRLILVPIRRFAG